MINKLLSLTALVLLVVLIGVTVNRRHVESIQENLQQAKQNALEQAKNYNPGREICSDIVTPAINVATGVKYTFADSCIPPGWKPDF